MSRIRYTDGKEIIPNLSQVWIITFPDKPEQRIMVLDASFNVEGVIRIVSVHNPGREFTVQNISVGEFIINNILSSFCSDGRKVDHNLCFV